MHIFIYFDSFDILCFVQPCNITCSMQYALSPPSTYLGSCKTCFFHIPVFGLKVSLIFPIIYLTVDLRSNLHIVLSHLVNLFWMTQLNLWALLFQFQGQLALKFHWVKTCFGIAHILSFFWPFWHNIYCPNQFTC